MALRFIFGGSCIDKSGYLCRLITRLAEKNRNKKYFIVVPEQFTLENQRKYVENSPGSCILNIDILSFLRLFTRVFAEMGINKSMMDDLGKSLIIRKVMEEQKEKLGFLKRGFTRPGVLDEIKSFLSELMQYDIHDRELEDMISACENAGKPMLYNKLKDIQLIYEKFLEKIRDNYLTTEGMYDVLEDMLIAAQGDLRQLKWLKDSVICLDGYTGFTPVQYKVIKQLLVMAEDVYLLADIDKWGYAQKDSQLFLLPHETINKMTEIAKEMKVEIAGPLWPSEKRILSRELLHLERSIFRYPVIPYGEVKDRKPEKTKDIKIIRAASPQGELRFAVSHIKELLQKENYSYGDIAVVTGDMESYGQKLKDMLIKEGIPCFLDQKKTIMEHPFVEYLRGFLRLFAGNFSEDDVTAFIKNPYFNFENEEGMDFGIEDKDILENYIRRAGIKSYAQWKRPFTRKLKENDKERLLILRKSFYDKISPYYDEMNKKGTVFLYSRCLYGFIEKERCYFKLMEEEKEAGEERDILKAGENEQLYGSVIGVLDKLVEVLGEEETDLNEFSELFETGLSGEKIGMVPPQMNVVLIGDLKRTRIGSVKAMFLLGANDGVIPPPEEGGGILTELEREFILEENKRKKKDYCLAPAKRDNTLIAEYYLYLNLTKPSRRLYLSYSSTNQKGEKKNPSYVIGKLKLIFPGLLEEKWEDYRGTKVYDILPDRGRRLLLEGIRQEGESPENPKDGLSRDFYRIFGWYAGKEGEWLERLIMSLGKRGLKGKIEEDAAVFLYGSRIFSSVTRFEKYAQCALNHFLTYGLNLKEREIFKVQNPDFGSLFHEVMREFFENAPPEEIFVENEGCSLTPGQEKALDEALNRVAASSVFNEALWEKERSRYIFKRLKRFCQRSIWAICIQIKRGDFKIKNSELPFGPASGDFNWKEDWSDISDKVKMAVGGIIDRLDVCETPDRLFYRIVDYKTGTYKVNIDEIYYGLEQQLFAYIEAAEKYLKDEVLRGEGDKEIVPAGAYYYNVKDPVIEDDALGFGGLEKELKNRMLTELKMEGYTNSEGLIPEYTDRALKKPDNGKQEENLSRASDIVQVKYKKDGTVDAHSKTMDTAFFNDLKAHVKKKMKEQAEEIYEGNTRANPSFMAGDESCKYCPYGEICVFADKKETQLKPLSKEEVRNLIRGKDNEK